MSKEDSKKEESKLKDYKFIAIGVDQKNQIWKGHFGMAFQYNLYDFSGRLTEERKNPYGVGNDGNLKHHDNPTLIVNLLPDCRVFIARRMGGASAQKLSQKLGVETVITEEINPQAAVDTYLNNKKYS